MALKIEEKVKGGKGNEMEKGEGENGNGEKYEKRGRMFLLPRRSTHPSYCPAFVV